MFGALVATDGTDGGAPGRKCGAANHLHMEVAGSAGAISKVEVGPLSLATGREQGPIQKAKATATSDGLSIRTPPQLLTRFFPFYLCFYSSVSTESAYNTMSNPVEENKPDLKVDETPISPIERRNSLEKHLQYRPDVQDLKNRNILLNTSAAP